MDGHPCFLAITRPVMHFRVTTTYLRVNAFLALMLWVFTMNPLLAITVFLFFHGVGIIIFTVDPLFLELVAVKMSFLNGLNFLFWQCKSYSPY